jgi:Protein of unknown function (DUF3168)
MATSLEVKLRSAAAANSTLVSLLGSSPFRWYGPQAPQGSVQPLVEVLQVSRVPQYSTTDLLITVEYRMQFTVWDTNLESARSVINAIIQFLKTFNAYNSGDSSPIQRNRFVNVRTGQSQAQTDPITYWLTLDAMIWNNETL